MDAQHEYPKVPEVAEVLRNPGRKIGRSVRVIRSEPEQWLEGQRRVDITGG